MRCWSERTRGRRFRIVREESHARGSRSAISVALKKHGGAGRSTWHGYSVSHLIEWRTNVGRYSVGIGDRSGHRRVHRDDRCDRTMSASLLPWPGIMFFLLFAQASTQKRAFPWILYIKFCTAALPLVEGVTVLDWPASSFETFHAHIHLRHGSWFYFKHSKMNVLVFSCFFLLFSHTGLHDAIRFIDGLCNRGRWQMGTRH